MPLEFNNNTLYNIGKFKMVKFSIHLYTKNYIVMVLQLFFY